MIGLQTAAACRVRADAESRRRAEADRVDYKRRHGRA